MDAGKKRELGFMLGIIFIPYVFCWFTLRPGHSNARRLISFIWAGIVLKELLHL